MADKLTPKQERFCQKYIETGNATEAYYASYDAEGSKPITANRRAKELLDNGKIAARVRALQAIHQKRHEVTVDSITKELDEDRLLARECKQPSAAVSAVLGKAKIHGLLTDKVKVEHDYEEMTDDELITLARSKGIAVGEDKTDRGAGTKKA